MALHHFETTIGDRVLSIDTGLLAQLAHGSVTVRMGDTVVLVTAVMSPTPREGIDFFPLTVDFEERLYAVGRIPGSFFRREGRPTTEAVLSGRLIDRVIRPMFPHTLHNEVQVIATVLSADQENQPDVLAMIGASAALSISDIPFDGPISGARIGLVNGEYVPYPTFQQVTEGTLDIVVAGTRDAVAMLEAGAKEVPEDMVAHAINMGQDINKQIIRLIDQMVQTIGKRKQPTPLGVPQDKALDERIKSIAGHKLQEAIFSNSEKGESGGLDGIKKEVIAAIGDAHSKEQVADSFERLAKHTMRAGILERGQRPDGRGVDQLRPLSAKVGLLPRTHGTGLFHRGLTQVLTVATLGSLGEKQKLDTLEPVDSKRYMHHYNFPPYSVGEVRRVGGAGRREIGHGALAERALEPVIPSEEEFPYTIRLVSEVVSSNGSTSMGSTCASTLALMDAGVPIKAPVAGISIGLVTSDDGKHYRLLTDIQGREDHHGDMDFKVAGTTKGITAIQLDIKLKGLPHGVVEEALTRAREARLIILEVMTAAIPQPRENLSPFAPRVMRISIPVDKIGALIGPGGKTIRGIIELTKATVDVEDDGTVLIGSPNESSLQAAKTIIEGLTKDVEMGTVYTGKVTRIMSFGAFVEILPGKEGLVRVSELTDHWVENPDDVVKVGDQLEVKVIEVDRMGRINLSHKALMPGAQNQTEGQDGGVRPMQDRGPRPGGFNRGPRPGGFNRR